MTAFISLHAKNTLIVLDARIGDRPAMRYCGPMSGDIRPEDIAILGQQQHLPGGPEMPVMPTLLNPLGSGWPGPAGLIAHRQGLDWAIDLRVTEVFQESAQTVRICSEDKAAAIRITQHFILDERTGVLSSFAAAENLSAERLTLDWLASACLPLDERLTRLRVFNGTWANEFQTEDIVRPRGTYLRENRTGRTSHSDFPGLYAGTDTTSETCGQAAAFHLGWSGNSRLQVDSLQDGYAQLQMGALLLSGEIRLGSGETYRTPDIHACWSNGGFGDVSRRLHAFVGDRIMPDRKKKPRPVHYNTWEAVYFDHNVTRILDLADKAAEVGAERFVLDDGWFGGRRNDAAGLGDWWVSSDIYPDGLHPVAKRVRELGMEFGLWFEPEMVNPDSDLYRAHPDWILQIEGLEHIPSRGQLTLDLTQSDVSDYLFAKMDALIGEYAIDYIKWDMNRDTQHPASRGRAIMSRQTEALYALIDRLRDAHPATEIESCSSGGARADYEILRRTERIWTSDNNDARHRHQIMRGASHFFPLAALGNHVGPKQCHITGRTLPMHFRAASAVFGHMGMELDLADETARDQTILAEAISLHKQHRALIHGGDFHRLETPDWMVNIGCVAADRTEALFSCALLDLPPVTKPAMLRFDGLDLAQNYRVQLAWPMQDLVFPGPSIIEAADLRGKGQVFSGAALADYGIQLPLVMPDTCLIYYLKAEG